MSTGSIILLILTVLFVLCGASFYYGFRMGVRAERCDWDLRRMFNRNHKVPGKTKLSEMQLIISKQLSFWQKQDDKLDSHFCENYMATLRQLRLHINRAKRESSKQWERMKPVWEALDFDRVTMNTCLSYNLSRNKMIQHLQSLFKATGGDPADLECA